MYTFLLATLRSSLRSRSVQGILLLGLVLVGCAYLAAAFSPRHPKTVALDVGFSGIRICLVLLGLLWVQELIGRELQQRTVLFSLTYPVPRGSFLIGRFLGISAMLAVAVVILGAMLRLAVSYAGGSYQQGFPVNLDGAYALTLSGLWLDAVLVAAFAMFLTTFATVSFLPLLLGLMLAVAGKGLGAVIDYLARGADGDRELVAVYAPIVNVVKWIVPDLSRLDIRIWPMYGIAPEPSAVGFALLMSAGYLLFFVSLAVLIFSRKEINC